MTIEARLLPSSSADYSAVESSGEKNSKTAGKMVSTIPTSAGVLLGKVELNVNVSATAVNVSAEYDLLIVRLIGGCWPVANTP